MAFRAARQLFMATQPKVASSAAAGAAKPKENHFKKNWLSDSATYPIMLVMVVASGLVLFQGKRLIFGHPDVNWDKDDRSMYIRDNDDASEEHHEHFLRKRARTASSQIIPGINDVMVKNKVRE